MKQLFFLSLLVLLTGNANADESIGSVILSFGQNYALDGQGEKRALKRKSSVFSNDLLVTGSKGRLQLKFTDGSRLSLKPNSEFRIAEYDFDSTVPEDGKAIYKLLKGGMRTISGKIGKENPDNYRMDTVVATIGIRGTHYGTEYTPQGLYTETVEGSVEVRNEQGVVLVNAGESVSINARTGTMQKGKATGQTSQGEAEEDSSEKGTQEESSSEEASDDSNDSENTDGSTSSEESSDDASSTDSTVSDQSESDDSLSSESEITDTSTSESDNSSVEASSDTSLGLSGDSVNSNTDATTPASDPGITANQPSTSAPNPTGNGSEAPDGAFSLVAFTENDPAEGLRDSSGIVIVNGNSSMTVDNTQTDERVTGVVYVDSNATSSEPCDPCTFTGPTDINDIKNAGSEIIGGTRVTWGRWNKGGVSVQENGSDIDLTSDFHFIYSDGTTPADVIAAKQGEYTYTFSAGNPVTDPELSTGNPGELIAYDSVAPEANRSAGGTYMVVNWNDQQIKEMNITIKEKAGSANNFYNLTEETKNVGLSQVLNGGELKLQGDICLDSPCRTKTGTLDGRMNMEFVGQNAEGAAISYGASGESTVAGGTSEKVSVVGTAVLK